MVSRIFGYESGEVPGLRPSDAARFLISVFPLILMAICCTLSFLLKFKDDEKPVAQVESIINSYSSDAAEISAAAETLSEPNTEDTTESDEQ